ncbi:MAG TPA: MlaD family protein, partial [Vicinamibacteria bacterium]|nr:MlaD family protein [Vicinamibacteria bacterium]
MGKSRKAAVGLFVLGGILLFGLGLFLIGDRKKLFDDSFVVFAEFERLAGLQEGARVRVAGLGAGEVLSISFPQSPEARFRVEMRVVEDLHPLVRTDSIATIQTEGLVGNMMVDIGEGSAEAPEASDGGNIDSREPFEIADLMVKASEIADDVSASIAAVEEDLTSALEKVEVVVTRADGLLEEAGDDVLEMTEAGRTVARDVESLVADVQAGRGTVGKLMKDEALHRRVEEIATRVESASKHAEATFENVREVSAEAKEAIRDIRDEDGPAPGILSDLSRTLAAANEAASDLAENTESMKRSFLFRGVFLDRGFFDLDSITPKEYLEGAIRGNHKVRRYPIAEEELVALDPAGEEVLSDRGKAAINAAMSDVLLYSPRSPLMVEGYAATGTLDERFLKARRRAFLVREYVVRTYFRDSNYTGFIALGGMSPEEVA